MKFALFNDDRIEATKGAVGVCPCCGSELVAKCGEIKVHHWSHKKKCNDHWWENETEWHRNWKSKFPSEWQEIIHKDESGEKHIADVKTSTGWTIEFQHSAIAREERDSRDYFYNKLIWVVDGTRRKTDIKQFDNLDYYAISNEPTVSKVHFPEDSRLIREWGSSKSLVLIDFSIYGLCLIYPSKDKIYITSFSKDSFIQMMNNTRSDEVYKVLLDPIQKALDDYIAEQEKTRRIAEEKARREEEKERKRLHRVKAYSLVNKKVAYIIGVCRNRFDDFDMKVASTTLNRYVEALIRFGYSDETIEGALHNKVIPKTKEVMSWTEWKNIMERFKQEVTK